MQPRNRTFCVIAGLMVLTVAGCQTTGGVDHPGLAAGDPGTAATPPMTMGPTEKEQRWLDAIEGLDFSTGRVVVRPAGRIDPEQARRDRERGVAELLRNDPVAAVAAFRDALSLWPDFIDAIDGLGDALVHKGRIEWAIATYRTLLDVRTDDADTRFKLAWRLWDSDQSDDAIAEMNRVLALDPNRAEAHERLAIWNYYTGDYAEAWRQVHRTRALGGVVPPQFIPLLQARMPDPGESGGIE